MQYIWPKKIIESSNVKGIERLLSPAFLQVSQITSSCIVLQNKDFIIFDFGKELSGGVRILTGAISPNGRLHLRFGESLSEANSLLNEDGSTNDHSPRDFYITPPGMSDLTFGQTGFRFLRIDFEGDCFLLQSIVASSNMDEREEVGFFESDDELLNEIWKTASYTLRLNLHNGTIWDGVKRDRLAWIGDCYPEIKALLCLYDERKEIENSLEFTKDQIKNCFEEKPFIPSSYVFAWLSILTEKYYFDNDETYLLKEKDYVESLLREIDKYIDGNGNVNLPFNFVDWPTHTCTDATELDRKKLHDEAIGVKALTLLTYRRLKDVYDSIDSPLEYDIAKTISILEKSNYDVQHFRAVASLVALAEKDDENVRKILFDEELQGISTFQTYFIFTALRKKGKEDLALKLLEGYHAEMLKLGATTFFEDFDVSWAKNSAPLDRYPKDGEIDFHKTYGQFCYKQLRMSLCHGWSAGVIPYIVESVVGLRKIGKNKYILSPHLSHLKKAKLIYPTTLGKIDIDIKRNNEGKLDIIVSKPSEIELIVKKEA